jgi:superfamily I DNA and RNA helicase
MIKLERRDIDLVIKDEKQMRIFVRFLIYSLKTLDGVKGSADKLLYQLNK